MWSEAGCSRIPARWWCWWNKTKPRLCCSINNLVRGDSKISTCKLACNYCRDFLIFHTKQHNTLHPGGCLSHFLVAGKFKVTHFNLRDCGQIYGWFCLRRVFGKYHNSPSLSLDLTRTPQVSNMMGCSLERRCCHLLK